MCFSFSKKNTKLKTNIFTLRIVCEVEQAPMGRALKLLEEIVEFFSENEKTVGNKTQKHYAVETGWFHWTDLSLKHRPDFVECATLNGYIYAIAISSEGSKLTIDILDTNIFNYSSHWK